MTDSAPVIRPLTPTELETLIDWAGNEGWNPGLADAEAFYVADPDGFIGCFVEGELAAAIAATAYGNGFGFIGLYISHPRFRGQGCGKRVWDAGMAHLEGLGIGLDGVPAQQENYRKSGFIEHYRTWRWSGLLTTGNDVDDDIVTVTPALLEDIEQFDRRFFPASRTAFLTHWTASPRVTLALVEEGRLTGYGTIRQCREGCKVGPLFTEMDAGAERLFTALAAHAKGQTLHIDVPEPNTAFSAFLEKSGFEKGFVTARMVRGAGPQAPERTPAGITTLELG